MQLPVSRSQDAPAPVEITRWLAVAALLALIVLSIAWEMWLAPIRAGGSPVLQKTVLPVAAEANLSIRLAPGQDVDEIAAALEALLRDAAPEGAELEVTRTASAPPGLVPPDAPAVQLGQDAFEKTFGRRPLLVRSGGSLPIVPALVDKGIPTIITGFALPESNIHSPNERLLAEYVPLGLETARELFRSLAALSG